MMKPYEKPSVCFESLRLREEIANPCWAYAAQDKNTPITMYYDPDPNTPGYVTFQIEGTNCNNAQISSAEIVRIVGGNSGEPFYDCSRNKPLS